MAEKLKYRQGDVGFKPVKTPDLKKLPKDVKVVKGSTRTAIILARGASNKHTHGFEGSESSLLEYKDGKRILVVPKGGKVVHRSVRTKKLTGEHDTIELPEGAYEVKQQRQYDAYEKKPRPVID